MKRRIFLSCVAGGAASLMVRGDERKDSPEGKAVFVKSGASLGDETMLLGDRSILRIKAAGSGPLSPLTIEQSELRTFGPPRHMHYEQDEWFFALAGIFRIEVGAEQYELSPGDFLFAPRRVPHVWKHLGAEGGHLIVGFEPAGMMLPFFRRFTSAGKLPLAAEMPALFAEHGMKVVGPPL